jgi:hypothetical protein
MISKHIEKFKQFYFFSDLAMSKEVLSSHKILGVEFAPFLIPWERRLQVKSK